MAGRIIVAGENPDGSSFTAGEEVMERIELDLMPGVWFSRIWSSEGFPRLPHDGSAPDVLPWFPSAGGFRFYKFSLPAEGADVGPGPSDPDQAVEQANRLLPGLLDVEADPDVPGRHRSASIDVVFILSGRVEAVLDDRSVMLNPGDVIVQNGAFHNWRNPGPDPMVAVGASIGAVRDSNSGNTRRE